MSYPKKTLVRYCVREREDYVACYLVIRDDWANAEEQLRINKELAGIPAIYHDWLTIIKRMAEAISSDGKAYFEEPKEKQA